MEVMHGSDRSGPEWHTHPFFECAYQKKSFFPQILLAYLFFVSAPGFALVCECQEAIQRTMFVVPYHKKSALYLNILFSSMRHIALFICLLVHGALTL
jgi:hypothetical protein